MSDESWAELRRVMHAILDRAAPLIGDDIVASERSGVDAGEERLAMELVLYKLGEELDIPIDADLRAHLDRAVRLFGGTYRDKVDAIRREDPSTTQLSMSDADHRAARALRWALYNIEIYDRDAARIRVNIDVGAYAVAFADLCESVRRYGPLEGETRTMLVLCARTAGLDPAIVDAT